MLARHLADFFPDYDIDCEYNLDITNLKGRYAKRKEIQVLIDELENIKKHIKDLVDSRVAEVDRNIKNLENEKNDPDLLNVLKKRKQTLERFQQDVLNAPNDSPTKELRYSINYTQSVEIVEAELDSIQNVISDLPFYDGFILNKESHASLMAITFDKVKLNTKNRIEIVRNIKAKATEFSKVNGVDVHLSGMPYIRTEITSKVVQEMKLFMILAVLVTALVLFVFFRSFQVVFFSLIVVVSYKSKWH
jgi:predicted RND superfamily exporter protein